MKNPARTAYFDSRREKLIQGVLAGTEVKAVASELGMSVSVANRTLHRAGIRKHWLRADEMEAVRKARNQG